MINLKRIAGILLFSLMTTSYMVAQQPAQQTQEQTEKTFSDQELTNFANAYQKVQVMSQGMQQKIAQMVQDEGMDVQKFNQIHQAQLTPGQEPDATPEEIELHGQIVAKIEAMQGGFEQEMQDLLKQENISLEKYEQIMMSLQTNPELQQRLQKILQG